MLCTKPTCADGIYTTAQFASLLYFSNYIAIIRQYNTPSFYLGTVAYIYNIAFHCYNTVCLDERRLLVCYKHNFFMSHNSINPIGLRHPFRIQN
jgi:hypothetical protein